MVGGAGNWGYQQARHGAVQVWGFCGCKHRAGLIDLMVMQESSPVGVGGGGWREWGGGLVVRMQILLSLSLSIVWTGTGPGWGLGSGGG